MALSRRLGVVAILGSCWFVAVGCGDDDSKNTSGAESGAGGEGGDDGSGSGGTKNTAGKGGSSAGTAGNGNGGSSAGGGMAGVGGDVAEAGAGGGDDEPLAGAGGTGPGGGGEGGGGEGGGTSAGGAGGEGGGPVASELKACSYNCETDGDCAVLPDSTAFKCNLETKKCENPAELCDADDDCVKTPWIFDCDGAAPCPVEGDICISWQGQGWCATPPELSSGCILGGAPETLPLFGQDGNAEVCVDRSWICGDSNRCAIGCADGLGCGDGKGDKCNEETHRCECEAGTECDSGVCGAENKCTECATNDDCAATAQFPGHDVCVDGKCGCSGPDKCFQYNFVGATTVCE